MHGGVWSDGGRVAMTGGTIDGLSMYLAKATISGGTIGSIFAEGSIYSEVVPEWFGFEISGGTIGSFYAIWGDYEITGGTFLDSVSIQAALGNSILTIKGGTFLSDFEYLSAEDLGQKANLIFYGDLMLDTPTLVSNGTYETRISGILDDGTPISQNIRCTNVDTSKGPCGDVKLVPNPPISWLVGSGLLAMAIGRTARRRKAD